MTPFFKSTGANEVEVVVTPARDGTKCWMWGGPNGMGVARNIDYSGTNANTVEANYILAASGYNRAWVNAMLSLVICKVGVGAGTATTGNVIVIPSTQVVENAELALPVVGETGFYHAVPNKMQTAYQASSTAGDKSMGMIAGTDEYLGTMTKIS